VGTPSTSTLVKKSQEMCLQGAGCRVGTPSTSTLVKKSQEMCLQGAGCRVQGGGARVWVSTPKLKTDVGDQAGTAAVAVVAAIAAVAAAAPPFAHATERHPSTHHDRDHDDCDKKRCSKSQCVCVWGGGGVAEIRSDTSSPRWHDQAIML
jgi:hypothetical protein